MSTISENAKKYELMVIVDPDIGEKAIKEHFEKLRKNIAALKGDIFYEDDWGVRDLAYQIKKRDRGYYMVLDLLLEPEHIQEFDRKLRLDTEVLRHMLTVLSAHYKPQSYAQIVEEVEEEKLPATGRPPRSFSGRSINETHGKIEDKKVSAVKVKEKLPDVVSIPVAEATESAKVTEAEEKSKKAQKESLEDIDEKLSKILDNPDINL